MVKKRKFVQAALPLMAITFIMLLSGCSDKVMVFDPKGPVGASQRDLIVTSSVLCGIILVPVLALTAWIVWRYRDKEGNKASYRPNWSHSNSLEAIWWGIPIVVILILGVITVKYTYALEPSKVIQSDKKPVTVQVTSLDWKWLFTYPEQGIATVNYLQIPENTPIKFELTSDAPMNSFWIPQLGGQIYTMSGMAMTLYLQADEVGHYFGTGANFSGEHFADMTFDVNTTTQADFDAWVAKTKQSPQKLTMESYEALAQPGKSGVQSFSSIPDGLFQYIVTKYQKGQMIHTGHGGMKSMQKSTDEVVDEVKKPQQPDYKAPMDHGSMHNHN